MITSTTNSRVWLITGTSTGLGRALLEAVLSKGERAVATVRKLSSLADLQAKYPKEQLLVVSLDVTDTDQISKVFKTIESTFRRLDVVVNNAGYALEGVMEATPRDEARREVETLFWGPVEISKQAIQFFREINPRGQGGRILNISSVAGYSANPTLSYYSAGKFALEGFTEAFNREMVPEWNIKGVIIEPGGYATNFGSTSLVTGPAHPAYGPDSPGAQFNKILERLPRIGDLAKAAQAMITIAGEPDPPLRLQLGSDAWGVINYRAQVTLKDQEKWAALSHGTNLEGYGPDILSKMQEAM